MQKARAIQEEKWNTYSHAIAIPLSIIGFFILLMKFEENSRLFFPVIIYSLSLILLFSASTIYHFIDNPPLKKKLRILDHISIYYLIAGTYTPFCMALLMESKGSLLLYLVWGIAIFGTLLKILFTGKFEIFSLTLYGIMGWLVIIDLPYLISNTSSNLLLYLTLGGVCYTFGIIFYANNRIPFGHVIWHLFVLGGAIFHWILIYSL
ncbi:PAQR family membrane homeostasis protein TrhA [Croceivirga thetidis]|uniref:Hemolysin III family protein n=1 Tax=Croceivirga thetidis TaxID=2721623 RepID=A0ABX1GUB4_9FLAO|nr:hemolysin III family protein [Croceivirga thetidis]NKI33542.1 hemolysin III family protein [Croceivirga thetidis]